MAIRNGGLLFADSSGVSWLVHCAAAAGFVLVVVGRAAAFRIHERQLEEDIELVRRAIALKRTRSSGEEP
jgi:hypothetical protein